MDLLLAYEWPGNLRELHHTIRTVVLFCQAEEVRPGSYVIEASSAEMVPALLAELTAWLRDQQTTLSELRVGKV